MEHSQATIVSLPNEREVVLTRFFQAPRALVFDAWTKPELMQRWWQAPGRTLAVREHRLVVGGSYHFVWSGEGRKDVGMRGVYEEVQAPARFVRTESWLDWDAGECQLTLELSEHGGTSTLTLSSLFPSRQVRDEVLAAGLAENSEKTLADLAAFLAA